MLSVPDSRALRVGRRCSGRRGVAAVRGLRRGDLRAAGAGAPGRARRAPARGREPQRGRRRRARPRAPARSADRPARTGRCSPRGPSTRVVAARRRGRSVAVVFMDIDHFKLINDSLGHEVGDEVLREVARRLTDSVRGADTVSRFGGDEFVVLCDDLADAPAALPAVERIRAGLEGPVDVGGRSVPVSFSIGVATGGGDDGAHGGRPARRRGRGDVPREGARSRPGRDLRRRAAAPCPLPPGHGGRAAQRGRARRAAAPVPADRGPRAPARCAGSRRSSGGSAPGPTS